MTSREINAAGCAAYTPNNNGEGTLGPLSPSRSVGLVILRGNDVPAKLGHLPRGNVTAPETPKIFLGNSIKLDAVHAGGRSSGTAIAGC